MRENVILIYFHEYFGYLIKSVQLIVFIFQIKILTQFHIFNEILTKRKCVISRMKFLQNTVIRKYSKAPSKR
jgi:hypothetical protein